MNRSDSIAKLAAALVKAQKDVQHAKKDSNNPFFKSKYADLTEVIDTIKKPLLDQGITFLQIVTETGVETTLLHESGEFISGITPVITAKPNDPQALGSAITYARRYGLQAIVGLGVEDDDGNAAAGKTNTNTTTNKVTQPAATTTFTKKDSGGIGF